MYISLKLEAAAKTSSLSSEGAEGTLGKGTVHKNRGAIRFVMVSNHAAQASNAQGAG